MKKPSGSEEWEVCFMCDGSGEGMRDGTICYKCRGAGEICYTDDDGEEE